MKWTLRLLIATALGLALALSGILGGGDAASGRELLAEVRSDLEDPDHDPDEALRHLGTALRLAESHGPRVLAAEVLQTRAELLMEIGATEAARADIETVLERYLPEDRDLRLMLVETDLASGDLERGLATTAALLADAPDFGPALVASGRLREGLADRRLAECHEILKVVLVADDALEAHRLLTLLVGRRADDPGRATNALQLQALFPPGEEERLARILALADEASGAVGSALDEYLSSLSHGYLAPQAILGILRALTDAGRGELAADLGMLARAWPAIDENVDVTRALLSILLARTDHERAGDVAKTWVRRRGHLEPEFLHQLAEALYFAETWNALLLCASWLGDAGTHSQQSAKLVYRGFSLVALGRAEEGAALLRRFASRRRVIPIPGMRTRAWLGVADASRTLGDPFGEREALYEVARLSPEESGDAWYRLAGIQLSDRRSGLGLPLEAIAQAMRLDPRRNDELLDSFVDVGEQLLDAEGRDMRVLYADLREELSLLPRRTMNAYELHRLAELYAADGEDFGVLTATRQMLTRYPGFLPAIDLQADALIRMGRMREAAELCVQRLEMKGRDSIASRLLDLVPAEAFSGEQIVRLMVADPARTGRLEAAAHLRARGDRQGALEVLQHERGANPAPEILRAICEVLADQGEYGPALAAFELLRAGAAPGAPAKPDQLELVCALRSRRAPRVRALVDALVEAPDTTDEDLELAADTLLRLGAPEEASGLLDLLAGRRAVDGALLLRASLCALAAGDLERAEIELDRAEPFLSNAAAAVARVQLASRREDWATVADSTRGLGDDGPAGAPHVAALTALLGANPERALELCAMDPNPPGALQTLVDALARHASGTAPAPADGLGPDGARVMAEFLLGKGPSRRSPLHAAALLLALETPGFQAFAAHELRGITPPMRENPWPATLEAEACLRLDARAEAENLLRGVTTRQGAFVPAWDQLEHAVRERVRTTDHPHLTELRERRLTSRARAEPDSPESLVLLARKDRAEGHPLRAQAAALAAMRARPGWVEALAEAARAASAAGAHTQAVTAWRRVLLEHPPHIARPFVPDLLDALAGGAAGREPSLDAATRSAALEEVSEHLADDPRLALARARLVLLDKPDNPALGIARAFGHLDAFLAGHPDTTLESLQPGSSEAWAEFYVAIDPEVAETFLRSQREREPGNVELWLQLGRVQRRSGAIDEATETLLRGTRISPDPRLRLELARSASSKAIPTNSLQSLLGPRTHPTGGRVALEAQLISARALLRQPARNAWLNAATSLAELWQRHERVESADLRRELGELFATALLARGQEGDAEVAEVALALAVEGLEDPYRLTYLRTLAGLARVGHGKARP
ncbi:MAG: hypothetical protein CMJ84_08895 [Planctomycetes bacterium]|nr:hypothetical protein [Planctomycetota bacterium]